MGAYTGYKDSLSFGNKCLRLVWLVVSAIFFRLLPGPFFKVWRIFLLRIFGAKIGRHCAVSASARIWAPWNLELGDYVAIGPRCDCYCVAKIRIGSVVTISQDSFLCTASHNIRVLEKPLTWSEIHIQDKAWIAARATVLPGVTIGEGAVIGACAVVSRDVLPWNVVGGNPAKILKKRVLSHD